MRIRNVVFLLVAVGVALVVAAIIRTTRGTEFGPQAIVDAMEREGLRCASLRLSPSDRLPAGRSSASCSVHGQEATIHTFANSRILRRQLDDLRPSQFEEVRMESSGQYRFVVTDRRWMVVTPSYATARAIRHAIGGTVACAGGCGAESVKGSRVQSSPAPFNQAFIECTGAVGRWVRALSGTGPDASAQVLQKMASELGRQRPEYRMVLDVYREFRNDVFQPIVTDARKIYGHLADLIHSACRGRYGGLHEAA